MYTSISSFVVMSAPRRFEKSYEEIMTSKLLGGIQRTEFVQTEHPIQRYHETYQFASAMLLSSKTGIPLFLVQLFNFSDSDDKFTLQPDGVLHVDDEKLLWGLIKSVPKSYAWVDSPIVSDNALFTTKKSDRTMYRMKLRNLWIDGGAMVNIFSQNADVTPEKTLVAMNQVNIIGAYASMDFDFKHNPADAHIDIAIAPHVSHGVTELWKDASWSVATQVGITHTNREAKKTIYKRAMMESSRSNAEKEVADHIMKRVVDPASLETPAAFICESVRTPYNVRVRTRTNRVPIDFSSGSVVKLHFV